MQRLDYIDQMKGLAILSVVLGHIYLPYTVEGATHPICKYYLLLSYVIFFLSKWIYQSENECNKYKRMDELYM